MRNKRVLKLADVTELLYFKKMSHRGTHKGTERTRQTTKDERIPVGRQKPSLREIFNIGLIITTTDKIL